MPNPAIIGVTLMPRMSNDSVAAMPTTTTAMPRRASGIAQPLASPPPLMDMRTCSHCNATDATELTSTDTIRMAPMTLSLSTTPCAMEGSASALMARYAPTSNMVAVAGTLVAPAIRTSKSGPKKMNSRSARRKTILMNTTARVAATAMMMAATSTSIQTMLMATAQSESDAQLC